MAFDDFKAAVLITGGTGGIGLHCAQQIALQRPDLLIVVASRSPPKIASPANITYIPLDLVSRASTHKLVDEWRFPPLIALVCNAALFTGGKPTFTPEGIEETFAACHLGHALLFFLLNKPTPGSGAVSKLAPDCRIVTVTSGLHDPEEGGNPIKPIWTSAADTAAAKGLNDPNVRYPSVKVGVALFSNVLARKAKEEGKAWTCLLYDPGFAPGTSLTRYQPPIVRFFVTRIFPHALWLSRMLGLTSSTPLESGKALAALALGTGTMRDAESGSYWQIWKSKPSANNTYDKMLQEDLWSWTMRELEGEGSGFGKL